MLFAYVDWPLLGPTELSGLVWLSILLLLPAIAAYQYATQLQERSGGRRRVVRLLRGPALFSCHCGMAGAACAAAPAERPLLLAPWPAFPSSSRAVAGRAGRARCRLAAASSCSSAARQSISAGQRGAGSVIMRPVAFRDCLAAIKSKCKCTYQHVARL